MNLNRTSSSPTGGVSLPNPFATKDGKATSSAPVTFVFGDKKVTQNLTSPINWALRKAYDSLNKVYSDIKSFCFPGSKGDTSDSGRVRGDSVSSVGSNDSENISETSSRTRSNSNVSTASTISTDSNDSGFGDEQTGSLSSVDNKDYDKALRDQSSLHFKQAKDSSSLLSKLAKNAGRTESADESDDVFSPEEVTEMAAKRQSGKETDALFSYQKLDQAHEAARDEYIAARHVANANPSDKELSTKADQKNAAFGTAGQKLKEAKELLQSFGMEISKDGSTVIKGDKEVYNSNRDIEKKN